MSFSGKIGLITGSASGIGLATVEVFLKEDIKGLTLLDIQETSEIKNLLKKFPNKIQFVHADVTSEEQVRNAFKQTLDKFEALDIVVHSAGVLDDRAWRRAFEINVNGAVILTLVSLEVMGLDKGGNGGSLVIISSESALGLSADLVPLYATSKMLSLGLSQNFGSKLFKRNTGVSVITICPGATATNIAAVNPLKRLMECDFLYEFLIKNFSALTVIQDPESVGKCVVKAIIDDESGSIWLSEENLPGYKVRLYVEHLNTV